VQLGRNNPVGGRRRVGLPHISGRQTCCHIRYSRHYIGQAGERQAADPQKDDHLAWVEASVIARIPSNAASTPLTPASDWFGEGSPATTLETTATRSPSVEPEVPLNWVLWT